MQKKKLIVTLLFLCISNLCGATVKEDVAKTIVKIKSGSKYSTGFFWKDGSTIITTLHSLENSDDVEVFIPSLGLWKSSHVIRFFKKGDLILLRLNNYTSQSFLSDKNSSPSVDTRCFTIGYYSGSQNYIDRDFNVGLMEGNTLSNLLPESTKKELTNLGFPALETRIVYLKGSLLHGFSGSPIVDMNGRLVGVSDGGLENGAASISWCINSTHINNLETSLESTPVINNSRVNTLFASEYYTEKNDTDDDDIVELGNFKFRKVRTRTFGKMNLTGQFSSMDAIGLNQLLMNFSMFPINDFEYDIYIEENTGATIVIPAGETLDEDDGMLVTGNDHITLSINLKRTFNMETTSVLFEQSVMNNFLSNWGPDPAWTYLMPIPGLNNSIIRRKAFIGNYNPLLNGPKNYLFELLSGKANYFLGVAAKRENILFPDYDYQREWAKYAIALQLTSFSN